MRLDQKDGSHAPAYASTVAAAASGHVDSSALELLAALLNDAEIGFACVNPAFEFTHVNPRFCAMLGCNDFELLGSPMSRIMPPDVWELRKKAFVSALSGVAVVDYPIIPRPDQHPHAVMYIEATCLPIRSGSEVVGAAVMMKDVDPIIDVKTSLTETRDKLRIKSLAFENAFDALLITDMSSIILDVNSAFTTLWGYTTQEIVGQHISVLHGNAQDGQLDARIIAGLMSTGHWTGEAPFVRKNGTHGTIALSVALLTGDENEPIGTVAAMRDVTEQREAAKQLEKQQQQLNLALTSARLGSWEIDLLRNQGSNMSATCRANLGLADDAPIDFETVLAAIHPDDVAMVKREAEKSTKTGQEYECQYRVIWPDGSIHWISAHGQPFYDENDVAIAMYGVTQDITADKETEQALLTSNRRYVEVLESMTDAFLALDSSYRFTYVNARVQANLKMSSTELIGKSIWTVLPEMCDTAYERNYRKAMVERCSLEFTEFHPSIKSWFDVRVYPMEDGIAVYARRADDRIRAETERIEAMHRQRLFLRDVLASVTEGKLVLCTAEDDLPPTLSEELPPQILNLSGGMRDMRMEIATVAKRLGYDDDRWHDLQTAAGEACMNAIVHAGGGRGQISCTSDLIQVRVEDQGAGIDVSQLPRATLEKGYTTVGSFGHGMKMMLQTVDRVFLLTGPTGTIVVLEQNLVTPQSVPLAWL